MTQEQILGKVFIKASNNGYKYIATSIHVYGHENEWKEDICEYMVTLDEDVVIDYRAIIFSHQFAKAFFGTKWDKTNVKGSVGAQYDIDTPWQYHLQEMVICEDPILYLKNFLN